MTSGLFLTVESEKDGVDQGANENKDQGSGFRVQGSGFRVQGSGFRVQGSGFRVQGLGSRVQGPRGLLIRKIEVVNWLSILNQQFSIKKPLNPEP